MNKGDRLVCIRSSTIYTTGYIDSNNHYVELPIKIGDFYFVESITSIHIFVNGWAFRINEEEYEPKSRLKCYKHYFMPYNEWLALERERQIKTILDDNN
jgi:hypothetical protein